MADDVYVAYGHRLCEKLNVAEEALGRVMAKPGRSDSELNKARQAVSEAEHKLRAYSDGRGYGFGASE
jgi:hypothetical protein